MTIQEKYQTLRTRINKHCPHLMELRFGCEVVTKVPIGNDLYNTRVLDVVDEKLWLDGGKMLVQSTKDVIKEVLGIPPTLQDVLRASRLSNTPSIQIDMSGFLYRVAESPVDHPLSTAWEVGPRFDLTKPLSEQSKETLDFLLSVIE